MEPTRTPRVIIPATFNPTMIDPTPHPSRLLKIVAGFARWSLGLLLAFWLLLTIAWGALHGWIVPRIGEFRPQLEAHAARALGVPVRIGAISARSEGLIPSVALENVALLDTFGREALRLPRVVVALSPRSLLNFGFEQLYIERPDLDIRRDSDGRITVAGLAMKDSGGDSKQRGRLVLLARRGAHQGRYPALDRRNAQRPAIGAYRRQHACAQRQLEPPHARGRHAAARLGRPVHPGRPVPCPAAARARWQLAALETGRCMPTSRAWTCPACATMPTWGSMWPRAVAPCGHGPTCKAASLWAGTADLALADVNATLAPDLQPLVLPSIQGRLGGRQLKGGFEFSTQGLQFTTDDGLRWPGGNVKLVYTGATAKAPAQGDFRADRLELAALAQIASRLPLGDTAHDAVRKYAPKGLVNEIQANWKGPLEALQQYQVRGRIEGLALAGELNNSGAAESLGLRGATVDLDMTQGGGKATLAIDSGALVLPGVFEDPLLPLDRLGAEVRWQLEGQRIAVQVNDVKFSNADAQGEARATWHTSDPAKGPHHSRFPGVLDLSGKLTRADGTRVHRYLPLSIPENARHYVRDGVVAGTASGVDFKVKGDLHDLPFNDPRLGDFRIAARVKDVTYAYVPPSLHPGDALRWPALTQLQGELIFERSSMQVRGATGSFAGTSGVRVSRVEASIPDLSHTVVGVNADARGPLTELLNVVNTSPLARMTGNALAQATGTGNADFQLKLTLPISNIDKSRCRAA